MEGWFELKQRYSTLSLPRVGRVSNPKFTVTTKSTKTQPQSEEITAKYIPYNHQINFPYKEYQL